MATKVMLAGNFLHFDSIKSYHQFKIVTLNHTAL